MINSDSVGHGGLMSWRILLQVVKEHKTKALERTQSPEFLDSFHSLGRTLIGTVFSCIVLHSCIDDH